MPREAVKLSPPPSWWADEFSVRQGRIRARILRGSKPGHAMTFNEFRSPLSQFSRAECEHALAALIAEGIVRRFERTDRLHARTNMTRKYTLYELTEAKHASPEQIPG